MAFYRRSKLGFDFLVGRNKNQIQNPAIGIARNGSFNNHPSFFYSNQQRRQLCSNKLSPFLFGSRKTYSSRFVPKDDRKGIKLMMLGSFLFASVIYCIGVYYVFWETIPYSNRRRHIVFVTGRQEKWMSELLFKCHKEGVKTLPEDDPQSIRVRLIVQDILNAVQCGLGDRLVVQSNVSDDRTTALEKSKKIKHMEVFDWECFVLEHSSNTPSHYFMGGKIFISMEDVSLCETDAELAFVIAHEIGHILARHYAERFTKLTILIFLATHFKSIEKVINDRVVNPLSRKHELEADYIGLLLMASAGYDPQASSSYWKKNMEKHGDISETDTHPSHKKRLEMLSQPKVMEEAFRLYQERINSNGLPENQSPN